MGIADFDYVFLHQEVKDMRVVEQVQKSLPQNPIKLIQDVSEAMAFVNQSSERQMIQSGKRILLLNNHKGNVIKYCPAKSPGCYKCCNLHTINLMSNCIFNCAYCILQNVLNSPLMQVHCNLDEIFSELDQYDLSLNEPVRICTGEIADSLALEPILHQAKFLVEYFSSKKHLFLELKTKSDQIESLLSVNPQGKTIVSFSINPEHIVKTIEFHTASLDARLNAARKLIDHGYKVAFNLDPVIRFEQWEEHYDGLFQELSRRFKPSEIAFVHVGLLRHTAGLDGLARQRFPGLRLFDEEFVMGPDRKMRYPKPIRESMYEFLYSRLRSWHQSLPFYACTEKADHYQKFFDWVPGNDLDLNRHVLSRMV